MDNKMIDLTICISKNELYGPKYPIYKRALSRSQVHYYIDAMIELSEILKFKIDKIQLD